MLPPARPRAMRAEVSFRRGAQTSSRIPPRLNRPRGASRLSEVSLKLASEFIYRSSRNFKKSELWCYHGMTCGGGLEPLFALKNPHLQQPLFKLWSGPQTKQLAQVMTVMETGRLVVEHNVVRPGDAHDVIVPGDTEQRQQIIHIILVCFRVIGVTDIASHRQ